MKTTFITILYSKILIIFLLSVLSCFAFSCGEPSDVVSTSDSGGSSDPYFDWTTTLTVSVFDYDNGLPVRGAYVQTLGDGVGTTDAYGRIKLSSHVIREYSHVWTVSEIDMTGYGNYGITYFETSKVATSGEPDVSIAITIIKSW